MWQNSGKPVWLPPAEALELFSESADNTTGFVAFELDELTGLTATVVKKVSEIFPNQITASDWPRFHAATIKEWKAILSTPAVTIISPEAAATIRRETPDRIVPSRHVYREKPGEGLGADSAAKCRWCVLGFHDPDLLELERASPTPQTSSINTSVSYTHLTLPTKRIV